MQPRESNTSRYPAQSTLPMSWVLASGEAVVRFTAMPGLSFILSAAALAQAVASFGEVTAVSVQRSNENMTLNDVVAVTLSFSAIKANLIPVSTRVTLILTIAQGVTIVGPGLCAPVQLPIPLVFSCSLDALRTSRNSALMQATLKSFQSTTTVSAVMMNPVTALTNTGMISILSLQQCVFSDIDPLDPSVNPFDASVGDSPGQYYRGTVVAGLATYASAAAGAVIAAHSGRMLLNKDDSFEFLRVPSILMIPVSLLHQGIVTSGTSLIRLGASPFDLALGVIGIGTGGLITVAAAMATTRCLSCFIVPRDDEPDDALQYEKRIPGLSRLLRFATWDCHWADGVVAGYKRRYLLLIDDLRLPWWTAVELSSGLIQGIIIGLRENDLGVCKQNSS